MATTFTPDEKAEIELMLWEYDRDGRIAIDNFFRREPRAELEDGRGHHPQAHPTRSNSVSAGA